MSIYTTFQCSVCRRTKDVLKDNVRAVPNQCTITKGCTGSLFKIGETPLPSSVAPVAGLTDWYARGKKATATPVAPAESPIVLSTSSSGVITLAIYQTDAQALARPALVLGLTQRSITDVEYQQYVFTVVGATTVVTGRDSTSKNLRFDQAAITEGRVFVRVNGVARFAGTASSEFSLAPNIITFNSALPDGAVVDISVFLQKNTVKRQLAFNANYVTVDTTTAAGSWGNVRWVKEYDTTTDALKPNKWWIYSCTGLDGIVSSSRLIINGIYEDDGVTPVLSAAQISSANIRFLLSSTPHENSDRYLNFYVAPEALVDGYALSTATSSIMELYADEVSLVEIYPPLQILSTALMTDSSFIIADTFTTTTTVSADAANVRLAGSKIIGPI